MPPCVPGYLLARPLGADRWRARCLASGRAVTLRPLAAPEEDLLPGAAERLAALPAEHLVRVERLVEVEGWIYAVEEDLPLGSLQARLAEQGPLSAGEIEALRRTLSAALATLHRAGLPTAGLGPGSVWFRADGTAALAAPSPLAGPTPPAGQSLTALLTGAAEAPPAPAAGARRRRRLLLAAAVVGPAAAAAVLIGGHGAPAPQPVPRWQAVVSQLEARRAEAITTRQPALLEQVYTPGAAAAAGDDATIAALIVRGLVPSMLRPRVRSVRPQPGGGLLVFDSLGAYQLRDERGRLVARVPARAPAAVLLRLVRTEGGWRIAAVSAAAARSG